MLGAEGRGWDTWTPAEQFERERARDGITGRGVRFVVLVGCYRECRAAAGGAEELG
jgi:hypothetical protein